MSAPGFLPAFLPSTPFPGGHVQTGGLRCGRRNSSGTWPKPAPSQKLRGASAWRARQPTACVAANGPKASMRPGMRRWGIWLGKRAHPRTQGNARKVTPAREVTHLRGERSRSRNWHGVSRAESGRSCSGRDAMPAYEENPVIPICCNWSRRQATVPPCPICTWARPTAHRFEIRRVRQLETGGKQSGCAQARVTSASAAMNLSVLPSWRPATLMRPDPAM